MKSIREYIIERRQYDDHGVDVTIDTVDPKGKVIKPKDWFKMVGFGDLLRTAKFPGHVRDEYDIINYFIDGLAGKCADEGEADAGMIEDYFEKYFPDTSKSITFKVRPVERGMRGEFDVEFLNVDGDAVLGILKIRVKGNYA